MFYRPEYVAATGSACVDAAFVMTAGPMKTAAAPWKLLPAWQATRGCVTTEGPVSVGHVNVSHRTQAQPVRTAPVVWEYVSSTWRVWSVGHLGQDQRRTGEDF